MNRTLNITQYVLSECGVTAECPINIIITTWCCRRTEKDRTWETINLTPPRTTKSTTALHAHLMDIITQRTPEQW